MARPKPLSKQQILAAMGVTKSNLSSARYLHVSYQHYKKWAKLYTDVETGKSLLELHKNQCGKGIPKFIKSGGKEPAILDIIEGKVSTAHFTPAKIKYKLIEEGYLLEECAVCGFSERRVLDFRIPLLMHFKDGNKTNYSPSNIELLCYNDYFLTVGNVFTDIDEKQIESAQDLYNTTDKIEWEVDEYHLQRLRELGLEDDEEDGTNQYISRI